MDVLTRLARLLVPSWRAAPPAPWAAAPGLVNTRLAGGGPARIEPSVAADPGDPARLIAACRAFRGGRIGIATAVSVDGGRNWQDNGLLPGLVPGTGGGNAVVAFGQAGHGFVAGIEATSGPGRRGAARVWRTGDGGRSYSAPVTAIAPRSGLADHPGLAADRGDPGLLYLTAVLAGGPVLRPGVLPLGGRRDQFRACAPDRRHQR